MPRFQEGSSAKLCWQTTNLDACGAQPYVRYCVGQRHLENVL